MDYCDHCEQPLDGGCLTLPWEDGDNADAYVTCPYCGYENILDSFGED